MAKTRIAYLDGKVQYGRGKAASKYGQTYNVLRLQEDGPNATSGSIFDTQPVFANFAMSPQKTTSKKSIENEFFGLNIFAGTCDNRKLQLGDVLVETGYEGEKGDVFVFAQRRPFLGQSLFVRCEFNVSLTRAYPRGGRSGQQPASGWVKASDYIGVDKASEWPLVLTNGLYSWTNVSGASPAAIPAGLIQLNRLRDAQNPKIPAALYREHFVIYIPLLSGVQLQELDRVNFPNQDRYELASVYTSEQTGLGGYILIVEKLGT